MGNLWRARIWPWVIGSQWKIWPCIVEFCSPKLQVCATCKPFQTTNARMDLVNLCLIIDKWVRDDTRHLKWQIGRVDNSAPYNLGGRESHSPSGNDRRRTNALRSPTTNPSRKIVHPDNAPATLLPVLTRSRTPRGSSFDAQGALSIVDYLCHPNWKQTEN